nr:MAG TPA: hypothetical protein [Caudoviricetes sp.]
MLFNCLTIRMLEYNIYTSTNNKQKELKWL